jgi:hypothetical protein
MTEHPENQPSPDAPQSQEIRHASIGALVPAHVARGIFTTGAVVLQGQHEFIVDFLLRMQQPHQVAARIVMPPVVVGQFIAALHDNLRKYEDRFRQSAEELYDTLKINEDVQSGAYANTVIIGHSPTEFSFDFITSFFPRSGVSARVFMATVNARRLLDSLQHSYQQFQQRLKNPPAPPEAPPHDPYQRPSGDWPPGL